MASGRQTETKNARRHPTENAEPAQSTPGRAPSPRRPRWRANVRGSSENGAQEIQLLAAGGKQFGGFEAGHAPGIGLRLRQRSRIQPDLDFGMRLMQGRDLGQRRQRRNRTE